MAVRVIVQARTTSSRLPAKSLLPIGGIPLAALVGFRAANTGLEVTVVTSEEAEDDLLAKVLEEAGLQVFRGSLDDTLSRFLGATNDLAPNDVIVRYTADNLLPDGELASMLADHVDSSTPYVSVGGSDLDIPYGLSGEAFLVSALRESGQHAMTAHEKEHVTVWMRNHLNSVAISRHELGIAPARMRCTIDTLDDYLRVASVFAFLPDPIEISWRSLLKKFLGENSEGALVPSTTRDNPIRQTQLILGAAQLGSSYGVANHRGDVDAKGARELLQTAVSLGISHVDTARSYGESEHKIGMALKNGAYESLKVITKLTPLDFLDEAPVEVAASVAVKSSLFQSLFELKLERVDVLLAHRAADWFRPGVVETLEQLQRSGRIQLIGASISQPDELIKLLSDDRLGYIQLPFSFLDCRWLQDDVQNALNRRQDVIITARSAFLQGTLVSSPSTRWPKNFGISESKLRNFISIAAETLGRTSAADLALSYVLGKPWISSVVVGAEYPNQLIQLATITNSNPLTAAESEWLENRVAELGSLSIDPSKWIFHESI